MDIARAQTSIDLESYLFQNDALGQRVAAALIQAAQRGIRVRVMVDGAGSPLWGTGLAQSLERAGAETKVYHPFPWSLWDWSRSFIHVPWLLRWLYLLLKINFRNHRKVCVIDNHIAYVGSFNITQLHLSQVTGGEGWRDTSVRLEGPDISELTRAFDAAWHHRPIKERLRQTFGDVRRDPRVRLNHTWHRRRILYKHLLGKITRCKQRIWITNAYFVPDNFLLNRLRAAARRGVDVRILLPQHSDVMMMPWASSTFYYNLLRTGIRIFEYLPSVLHAKTLILDDWMLIGSSNLNHRSLLHDLEADIHIRTESAREKLAQQFLIDLNHAREISLPTWHMQR